MNTGILKAEGLCKSYGSKRVLEGLDLTIQPGRIYGLIGRNGAGKTTLLGILTGQNTKDSGQVTCDGEPVWENCRALEQICFSRELQPTLFSGPNNQKVLPEVGRHILPQLGPGVCRPPAERVSAGTKKEDQSAVQGADVYGDHPDRPGQPGTHHHSG